MVRSGACLLKVDSVIIIHMTQQEFIEKYNALVAESGFQIVPQMTLSVIESPKKEETKEVNAD